MAVVYLNRNRKKRIEQGHPWVYKNEVERIEGEAVPGSIVQVHDHAGRFLASGYINPLSQMIVRIVSYQSIELMDDNFFISRIRSAWNHRERFLDDTNACRIVYGEADFLPGLIIDKYGDMFVLQIVTLGMDRCREHIIRAIMEVFQPIGIYERSDVPVRQLEGLELVTGLLYGECRNPVTIRENELMMEVDIVNGQKTGYFFDQRENRESIGKLMNGWGARSGVHIQQVTQDGTTVQLPVNANGKIVTFPYWDGATVLECFSHTGSFTLHACKYGAKKVTCLDISEHAIQTARRNVELNGFQDRVEFVTADAFEFLREQVKGIEIRKQRSNYNHKNDTSIPIHVSGKTWDVVILDPPAFAKTKGAIAGACRGYKDINLHALKLVNEGGYLVTASCSFHIRPDLFLQVIQEAASDAGKILRLVEFNGAGKDHPQILGVEEGHYLKFAVFEVRSRIM